MEPWESVPKEYRVTKSAAPEPWESAPQEQPVQAMPESTTPVPAVVNGVQTVVRKGFGGLPEAWFGPEQGNNGAPGWFNEKGQRVGLKQGVGTMEQERFANPMDVIGQGATDLPVKVAQIGAHLGGSTALDPYVTQREEQFRQQYGTSPGVSIARGAGSVMATSGIGKLAGAALSGMPIPAAITGAGAKIAQAKAAAEAVKGGRLIVPIAETALKGAALAPLYTPEANVQSEGDFWSRQGQEAATGAKVGGAFGALATGVFKGIPALKELFAKRYRTDKAAKLLDDLVAMDVTMKPHEIIEATKLPPKAIADAEAAANRLKNELANTMEQTPYSLGELKKVAAGGGKRSGAATAILEKAIEEGDPDKILSTSAGIRAIQEKIRMDTLGSTVEALSQDVKGPLQNAANAIDERIGFLKKDLYNVEKNAGEIKALTKLKERFLGTPVDELGTSQVAGSAPIVIRNGVSIAPKADIYGTVTQPGQSAKPSFGVGPTNPKVSPVPTYAQARATRSNLTTVISDLYKGNNAVTGQADAATLQAIKNGLQSDMSAMAQNSGKPALAAADKVFQSEYSKYAGTFKDPAVIKVIQNPDPDSLMKVLAKAGPSKAQKIMDVLDPKGQAAYAVGTFNQALEKAINKRTGGEAIPGNISGGIVDVKHALEKTITDPKVKAQVDSLLNVLQALAKSSPKAASALGQRITGSIVEGSSKAHLVSKIYEAIKDKGVNMFFDSPKGMDFLFKTKGLNPDSKMWDNLITKELPVIAGVTAGSPKPEAPVTPVEAPE